MTAVYTYTEARQNLASVLDKASAEGEVRVKRRDGQVFVIKPERLTTSALDVEGIDLNISTDEILQFIAESRRFGTTDDANYD
jgi:hypothetical protein